MTPPAAIRRLRTTLFALVLGLGLLLPAAVAGTAEGIAAFKAGNYDKALEELEPAAANGDAEAQYYLARMYDYGKGVEKNPNKALTLYRDAALDGYPAAQGVLGYSYDEGIGVNRDDKKAVKWYRKAAEQGDVLAQRALGLMYEDGEGVKRSFRKAAEWYAAAAKQGDLVAHTKLANIVWMGSGEVEEDRRTGLRMMHYAVDQDHAEAQSLLCSYMTRLYPQGDDRLIEAFKWCRLAADQGNESAKKGWEAATRWFISEEQQAEAARRAEEWAQAHRAESK